MGVVRQVQKLRHFEKWFLYANHGTWFCIGSADSLLCLSSNRTRSLTIEKTRESNISAITDYVMYTKCHRASSLYQLCWPLKVFHLATQEWAGQVSYYLPAKVNVVYSVRGNQEDRSSSQIKYVCFFPSTFSLGSMGCMHSLLTSFFRTKKGSWSPSSTRPQG